jgi:hypothetical protein
VIHPVVHQYVYNIRDNDLQKQLQIKELRNVAKRDTFTKEEVAEKIWKYRYLPPDPRTIFFERNASESTKFRETKPVPEFTRMMYTDSSVDLRSKKSERLDDMSSSFIRSTSPSIIITPSENPMQFRSVSVTSEQPEIERPLSTTSQSSIARLNHP